MSSCAVCHQPIAAAPIVDPETDCAFHLVCATGRGLDELVTTSLFAIGAAMLAFVVVWAS